MKDGPGEATQGMPADSDAEERARLQVLHALHVLDTPTEAAFERITALATRALGIETAAISLVDEHRQWFKSRRGLLDCSETPRAWAFCDHTIRQRTLLEVLEPERDARFEHNPLVTQQPHLRYYAGVPLRMASGHAVGTLCVLDNRPRAPLDATQQAILTDLAAIAVRELEVRKTLRQSLALLSAAPARRGP